MLNWIFDIAVLLGFVVEIVEVGSVLLKSFQVNLAEALRTHVVALEFLDFLN